MISRALFGLLFRRSLAATLGLLAVLTAAIVGMRSAINDSSAAAHLFFLIVFNALAYTSLVSLGGFLGKVTMELEGVRLARTVPGLRRRINASVVLLVPVVASLALLFLEATVPGHFRTIHWGTQWFLNVFLFSLGLGLGSSWLLYAILAFVLVKLGFVLEHLRNDPVLCSTIALGGAGLLLAIRHGRFLTPRTGIAAAWLPPLAWLAMPLAGGAKPRRTEGPLRGGADWTGQGTDVARPGLLAAGAYERLGQPRGLFLGKVLLSAAMVYGILGLLILAAAKSGKNPGFGHFVAQVFSAETTNQQVGIMRVLFAAAVFGCMAYVCAVVLDTSLRPTLWHPISRRHRGRAVFLSHLRQNLIFASTYAAVALLLVAGFSRSAGVAFSPSVVGSFLLPPVVGLVLAPIPQAMFPNGAEVFRTKVNPLTQLLAGVTGGLSCLLTIYWTAYWPLKGWHEQLSTPTRGGLLVATGVAMYAIYYAWLRRHYARTDFGRRSG